MRQEIRESHGDKKQRVGKGFLLFPKTLFLPDDGPRQWRCLETTEWVEEWHAIAEKRNSDYPGYWLETEWLYE